METRVPLFLAVALTLLALAGCSPGVSPTVLARFQRGLLYSRTIKPVVLNMQHSERGTVVAPLDSYRLSEPITRINVSAEWSSYGIGDAMRANKLKRAQYADIERFSILLGLFERRTIRVYGDPSPQH